MSLHIRNPRPLAAALLLLTLVPGSPEAAETGGWRSLPWVSGYAPGLQQARAQQRPALLYFQALWCSWCQVYERNILGDRGIRQIVRQRLVPVLLDYDDHPDLFRRMGGVGLPYTVIVSPEGEVLARLPGILTVRDMRETLEAIAAGTLRIAPRSPEPPARATGIDARAYHAFRAAWLEHLERLYEPESGLLTGQLDSGAAIKRPEPRAWLYLAEHDLWPARTRPAAVLTLQRLYDDVDGGFFYFRDSQRRDEHLETAKLLETNAWLAAWMAFAGTTENNPQLLAAAGQTVEFLERVLWDADGGGFFQAMVADADYYKRRARERARHRAPAIVRVKRTDTNAQAAWALARIGGLLGDARAMRLAEATLDYLLEVPLRDGRLYHARRDDGFGAAFDLPDDVFWLLAAAGELQRQHFDAARAQRLRPVIRLAAQWLDRESSSEADRAQPTELLGLVAWVTVTYGEPRFSAGQAAWALTGVVLGPEMPPQDPVLALLAWERLLQGRVLP